MENNKLIAEFMGYKVVYKPKIVNGENFFQYIDENSKYTYCISLLRYNDQWDWLMSVVERIENFGYEFIIVESRCYVKHNTDHSIEELFHIETIGSKIDTTYKAVLKFINNYNKKQLK